LPSLGCHAILGGTAGRGVGKVEPGSEKILDVGLNFKIGICPAHSRSLEKLRALCEAYAKSIKRDHNKIHIWSSKPRRCICAASTEHKETSMNDLKMSVALRICRAYTKKKLSSLKILSTQMYDEKSDSANHKQNDENEEENARERSDENNISNSLLMRS